MENYPRPLFPDPVPCTQRACKPPGAWAGPGHGTPLPCSSGLGKRPLCKVGIYPYLQELP